MTQAQERMISFRVFLVLLLIFGLKCRPNFMITRQKKAMKRILLSEDKQKPLSQQLSHNITLKENKGKKLLVTIQMIGWTCF